MTMPRTRPPTARWRGIAAQHLRVAVVALWGVLLAGQNGPVTAKTVSAGSAGADPGFSTGVDHLVNNPGQDASAPPNCNTQNGPTLARSGSTVVASWLDGRQCDRLLRRSADTGTTGISVSGYGRSDDGGLTWSDEGTLDPPEGRNLFGDGVVAAGGGHRFYYATLIGDPGCCRVGVATSTDGGRSFAPVREIGTDRPGVFHDKPWIAADMTTSPHAGNVYVAWTEFAGDNAVLFARSTDRGSTFGPSVQLSVPVSFGGPAYEYPGVGTQIAVGPGGEVYVAWADSTRLWFTRSLDGGTTFSTPVRVSQANRPGRPGSCFPWLPAVESLSSTRVLHGDIRVFTWPSLAVDVSGSALAWAPDHNPHRGTIYLAAAGRRIAWQLGNAHGDESDVLLFRSVDKGETWTNVRNPDPGAPAAERVLNDDDTTTDQFHPKVAVAEDGAVAVSWYDRRRSQPPDDPSGPNWNLDVFAVVSTDGGQTFGPNFRVTDRSFPPARTNPQVNWLAGCYMGDFNGMVPADGGGFLLAWGDNRDGTIALPDPNVYADFIRPAHVP